MDPRPRVARAALTDLALGCLLVTALLGGAAAHGLARPPLAGAGTVAARKGGVTLDTPPGEPAAVTGRAGAPGAPDARRARRSVACAARAVERNTGPARARGALVVADPEVLRLILEEGGQSRTFDLDLETATIGRTADNAIKIADALSSRHHCQVRRTPEGFVVEDLKSRNGTKLNGAALTEPKRLEPGDRIEVGDSHVHFKERRSGAAARPKAPAKKLDPDMATPTAGTAGPLGVNDVVALRIEAGPGQGQTVKLAPLPFVIGRKKGAGLVVDEADVSNEHCMVVEDSGLLHLVDLGSSNGTFVDGERLRGRTPLRRGAVVGLGAGVELRVELDGKPEKKAPRSDRVDEAKPEKKAPRSDRVDEAKPEKKAPKSDRVDEAKPEKEKKVPLPKSDRVPRSDRVARAGSARAERPKKKDDAEQVDEVESLDGLGGDDADATKAAKVVASEGDVAAGVDITAKLEAAATDAAAQPGRGGGGAAGALVGLAGLLVVGAGLAALGSALVARPEGDPRPADGLVDDWSFEEGGKEAWTLGDGGAIVRDGVGQGQRALQLTVAPGARPEAAARAIRVQAGKGYRVRASIALDGRVGAALRVDWRAEDDRSLARSSWALVLDPSAQGQSWRDVGGTVVAPRGASLATVVVVGLGEADGPAARVRVDRVHVSGDATRTPESLEGPAGLVLRGDPRGVLSIERQGRDLATDLALALGDDDLADQSAARVDQPLARQTDGSLLCFGALPDPGHERVEFQQAIRPAASGLGVRWATGARTAPLQVRLLLPRLEAIAPLELDGEAVAGLPEAGLEKAGVREMAWGRGAGQVSFRFSSPAKLRLEKRGAGARLVLTLLPSPLATGEVGVGFDLGAASSATRAAIRRAVDEAEAAGAKGEWSKAIEAWRKLQAAFPHEKELVERARREVKAIEGRAERLVESLAWLEREARDLPVAAFLVAARGLLADAEGAFGGTPHADRAKRHLGAVEVAVQDAARRERSLRVRELVERGQRLREAGHTHLARMVWQAAVETGPADDAAVADAKAKLAALPAEAP